VPKKKAKQPSVTAERALPIRELLQSLIRDRVKTREEKEKLAAFLDQAVSSIDAMMYYGEGGLDSWISALMHCYDLKPEVIQNFFTSYRLALRKTKRIDESDRLWLSLEDELDANAKYYWASLIRASLSLEKELAQRRRRQKG
jgi:hypothetical protein